VNTVKLHPFGVEVTNLDLSKPRTKDESAELLELFDEHYLVLARGQHLSDDDHLRIFHDLFPGEDLGDETGSGSEVCYVSNVRPDGIFGDRALTFHSDYSFTTKPTRLISLYGYDVDAGAAPTEFSNGELALHALPDDLRQYLADKKVVCATDLVSNVVHLPSYNLPTREDLSGRPHEEVVRAAWPVIMNHPRTGRPMVYVNESHAHHLHGIPLAESRAVLERLCGYLYVDEHVYRHEWVNGDFLLWDNIALSHGRRQTPAESAKRTLRRVRGGGCTSAMKTAFSQRGLDGADDEVDVQMEQMKKALGLRIRDARLECGMTQHDVTKVSGIEFSHEALYEVGIWMPSIPELCALADAFGIKPGRLLDDLGVEASAPSTTGAA
jgi:taurine dioxygenase